MHASIVTLTLLFATATATAIPTTPQTDNCGYYFHETSGKSIDIPGNMACLHNKGSSSDLDYFNIAAHCEKCIWWSGDNCDGTITHEQDRPSTGWDQNGIEWPQNSWTSFQC